jgi:hypothetical protein
VQRWILGVDLDARELILGESGRHMAVSDRVAVDHLAAETLTGLGAEAPLDLLAPELLPQLAGRELVGHPDWGWHALPAPSTADRALVVGDESPRLGFGPRALEGPAGAQLADLSGLCLGSMLATFETTSLCTCSDEPAEGVRQLLPELPGRVVVLLGRRVLRAVCEAVGAPPPETWDWPATPWGEQVAARLSVHALMYVPRRAEGRPEAVRRTIAVTMLRAARAARPAADPAWLQTDDVDVGRAWTHLRRQGRAAPTPGGDFERSVGPGVVVRRQLLRHPTEGAAAAGACGPPWTAYAASGERHLEQIAVSEDDGVARARVLADRLGLRSPWDAWRRTA